MSTQWLRLWHDMPTDPKWRTIARASKQRIGDVMAVYLHVLVCASNATERGRTQSFNCEDVASALDLDTEQVVAIVDAMQGRVLDGDSVRGWEKRQVAREDGSAERAKRWRESKKQAVDRTANATERTQTQGERKQTPDTDTDTEQKQEREQRALAESAAAACKAMVEGGVPPTRINQSHPDLLALVADPRATPAMFRDTAREGAGKPMQWVVATIAGRLGDAARPGKISRAANAFARTNEQRFEPGALTEGRLPSWLEGTENAIPAV